MELNPKLNEVNPRITVCADELSPEATFGGGLHGRRVAMEVGNFDETRQKEQPWMQHAAMYFALGLSNQEVAEACEVTPGCIASLLKNAWFAQRIREHLTTKGKDLMALVEAEAINSFVVLCQIRDDEKVSPTVRSANAKSILEWKLGKPTQRVEMAPVVSSNDPVAEAEMLEQKANRLREQL